MMTDGVISRLVGGQLAALGPFVAFATESVWARRGREAGACDFVLGNPHDPLVPGFAAALGRAAVPRDKDWFAYKMSEPGAREVVAASLRARTGIAFAPDDIAMTNGAFSGLTIAMRATVDPGDEVIFISPPWFFYETLIHGAGGTPVRVRVREDFDLDVAAIEAAITPRTRGIIVNSPHNPTGRIYARETLEELAAVLGEASRRHGRPIIVYSDEAYARVVFDGAECPSPAAYYPETLVIYTYGKTLLTPGERIGYVAVNPAMSGRAAMGPALLMAQILTGWAFPNATLQHGIGELDRLSIDLGRLQRRRDRMVPALRAMGYEAAMPAGTFYVLVASPEADDLAFTARLAEREVYVLPGAVFEMPGWFRVSLTANDEMVERALPIFAAVKDEAGVAAGG